LDITFPQRNREWLSWVGDIIGYYGDDSLTDTVVGLPTSVNVDRSVHNFLVGPRASYRRYNRIVPFGQALIGLNRSHYEGGNFKNTDWGGALSLGGGADWVLNDRFNVRLIQADYLLIGFGDDRLNNGRLSFGVVYKF
jgi:hypothetical protein